MLLAIPYENGMIFPHFGRTPAFKIYYIENNDIIQTNVISTNGHGHSELAVLLESLHVDTVICGGMWSGMRRLMSLKCIDIYPGVSGYADDAADALIDGVLDYGPDMMCSHDDTHEKLIN